MGEPSSPQKRPPYTRLHAVVLLAAIMVIATLLIFLSNDAEATRQIDQAIKLNDQVLTQIHASLNSIKQNEKQNVVKAALNSQKKPVEEKTTSALKQTTVKIKPGHSLAAIFNKQRLNQQDLYRIMQKGKKAKTLRNLQPGRILEITNDEQGQIHSLSYQMNRLQSINVSRVDNDFIVELINKPIEKRISFSEGIIQSSLFEAGKQAGLSDTLVMEMAGIFGWDVDFALDIRQGDKFSILYEEQFIEGKKHQTGTILAAEFTNQGKTFKAIHFTDQSGRSNYYTPEGLSMRKAFLRTPVDFRRISSRFGKRRHPTLNRMRLHKGVDYAAPRGTPIRVSGDGKVVFKGRKGGYGRTVIIQHGGRYSTLYAHMSSYRRGVHVGKRVKQGQIVGYVGSSGRATGPHLHYEFRVNGAHRNPLTVKLPSAKPINKEYKSTFVQHAQVMISQIEMFKETNIALNYQ